MCGDGRTNHSRLKHLVRIVVAKEKCEDIEKEKREGVCLLE